jgi:hypothetical protein
MARAQSQRRLKSNPFILASIPISREGILANHIENGMEEIG